MKIQSVISIIVAASVLAAGCGDGKRAQQSSAPDGNAASGESVQEEEVRDPVQELFAQAQSLFDSGATNETVQLISDALNDEEFSSFRPQILPAYASVLILCNRIDDAKSLVKSVLTNEPELSANIAGPVFFHLTNSGLTAEALAWTEEVLAMESLSQDALRIYLEWNLYAAIKANEGAKAVAAAERFYNMAPANNAIAILRRAMEDCLSNGNSALLATMLDRFGKSVSSDASTRTLISSMKLRLLASQGKWSLFAETFGGETAAMQDRDLLYVLRSTLPAALNAKHFAETDAVCQSVIEGDSSRRLSYEYAARQWLESASRVDFAEVPVRLEKLLASGKIVAETGSIFQRHAYDDIDDMKFVAAMKPIGERLLSAAADEDARAPIQTIVLDYSFLLEDYDSAITILESRIAGYDDNWHAMALTKIKAHKAMKENRPLDAIREFRAFMATVQSSGEEETSDPSTGVVHTREMILGRNAARIGDIYASIPDAAKAAAAYAEAKDYFTKALETAKDPETAEIVKKELGAIAGKGRIPENQPSQDAAQ